MNGECADMMGYTREELKTCFAPHIEAIAKERGDQSEEDILEEIREWYNGDRFSEKEAHVYNPFSTLNFL